MNRAFYIIVVPAIVTTFGWVTFGWGWRLAAAITGAEIVLVVATVIFLARRQNAQRAAPRKLLSFLRNLLNGRVAMVITEIFKSIQGEGTRAGLPCVFVRLTGCNLRCTWCDTAYAFYGGTKASVDEVLEKVRELAGGEAGRRVSLVEITGGEPLLQPETPELAERLLAEGYTTMIETSGERFVGTLPREVIKIWT